METRSKLVLSFGFVCSMYAYFGQAITMATCIALFLSVAMYYITKYTLYIGLFAFFYLYFGKTIIIATCVVSILSFAIYKFSRGKTDHKLKNTPILPSPVKLKIQEVGKRFDPTKSTVSTETMVDFLDDPRRSKDMEFEDFPGIGPKLAKALRADGINNPMELVRMFKRFNEESDRTGYNCNRLYDYFHSLPSRHPRILKGHANWHAPTFAVASYADERCSWYTYDANDKWLQTIKEEDDM